MCQPELPDPGNRRCISRLAIRPELARVPRGRADELAKRDGAGGQNQVPDRSLTI